MTQALVEAYATPSPRDQPRGCLVVNATIECAPEDREVADRLAANRTGLEVALTSTLLRARAQGEIAADADPPALARSLLVVLNGMQVLARGEDQGARLADAARLAMNTLR